MSDVEIAGDYMDRSIADFQRACKAHIGEEQQKPSPDTALIALLCDAVRCSRELSDADRRVSERKPTKCPAGHGLMTYDINDDRLHCHCGAVASANGNMIVNPDPLETKRA